MSFVYSSPVSESQLQKQISEQATGNSLGEIRDAINGLSETLANKTDKAINELGTDLAAETSARQSDTANIRADLLALSDTVTTEISASLAASRAETFAALEDETLARIDADLNYYASTTALIESETALRAAADNALDTGLTAEIQARISEDAKLSAAIANERTDRANAISNLGATFAAAIGDETTARQNADAELQSSVARVLSSYAPLDSPAFSGVVKVPAIDSGSASNAAATKAYVDSKIASASVNVFTAPTANTDGTAGCVPAPKATSDLEVLTNLGWRKLDDTSQTIGSMPVQSGSLTYNGAVQYPTWLNFDPVKMQITGETSGSDAKTYTATVKPIDLYLWADTKNQEERTITWKIDALKLAKPAAAVTAFNFNRLEQALTVSNFDETYMSQTGTASATNAGDYSAAYVLKSKTNTTWSDGSTGNVIIPWAINVLKLAKPSAAVSDFVFDGDSKTVAISNFNNIYMTETGVKSASAVGNYSLVYALLDASNTSWDDGSTGDVSVNWRIVKRELSAAQSSGFAQNGAQTYSGSEITVSVTNFDPAIHVLGGDFKKTVAGTYTATVAPAGSYTWNDGTTTPKSFTWTIGKAKVDKPAASATSINYTGATITFVPTYAPDSSAAVELTSDSVKSASLIGSYAVKYNLRDTANCEWQDGSTGTVTINWEIVPNRLSTDLSSGFAQTTALTYNGQNQTVTISHTNPTFHTITGTAQSDAGTYSASITPIYGYAWSDGTTATKNVPWSIKPVGVNIPYLENGEYEYTGATINAVNDLLGYDSTYVQLTGDLSKSEPNAYTIVASLKNAAGKANYVWNADAANPNLPINDTSAKQIYWRILGKPIEKPTFGSDSVEFTYSGSQKSVVVNGYQSTYMDSSGTLTATDAGTYTLIYSLKDTATTRWADNTTAPVKLTWKINPQNLSAALSTFSVSGEYFYNEKAQTVTISGFNANYHEITGNSGTNPSNYTAYVSPKPNYAWSDGTTAAKSLPWAINRAVLKLNMSNLAVSNGTLVWSPTYVYSGNSVTVTGSLNYTVTKGTFTGTLSTSGVITATNAGSYSASAYNNFVHFIIANNSTNFASLSIAWGINRKTLTATQSTFSDVSYTFDGAAKTNPFPNFDATYHSINRVSNQNYNAHVNAGTYSHTISVNSNYAWNDGSTATKTATITINPAKLAKPTAVQSAFTYSANAVNFLGSYVSGYDSATMNVTGSTSATVPGDYTATFALKNTSNYHWADDTTANVALPWKINPYPIARNYSEGHAQATALTWSGSEQTVTISNVDTAHTTIGGTVKGTNAGSYSATLTPNQYCTWYDGTTAAKTVPWTIQPKKLAKPTCNKTSTETPYTGSEINWLATSINGYDSANMSATGTTVATNLGSYSFTISPLANRAWSDGSTDAVTFGWSVVANRLSGQADGSHFYVTNSDGGDAGNIYFVRGGGQAVTVNGYDSNSHTAYRYETGTGTWDLTVLGGSSEYAVGSHTYYLAPNYGYCWADSTTARKPVTFNIIKAPTHIVWADADSVDSNGNGHIAITDTNTMNGVPDGLGRKIQFYIKNHNNEIIPPRINSIDSSCFAFVSDRPKMSTADFYTTGSSTTDPTVSVYVYGGVNSTSKNPEAWIDVQFAGNDNYEPCVSYLCVAVNRSISTLPSWARIKEITDAGDDLWDYGEVGDTFNVTSYYTAVFLETFQRRSLWCVCKRRNVDGYFAFTDNYGQTGKGYYHTTAEGDPDLTWAVSHLRESLASLYNNTLSAVKDYVTPYTHGGATDYFWCLDPTASYYYFENGNGGAFHDFNGNAVRIWTGQVFDTGYAMYAEYSNGSYVDNDADARLSYGVVPCFLV